MERTKKIKILKLLLIDYIPLFTTLGFIVVLGIKEGQSFIKMLPVLTSLVVYLLMARVNRWNFMLGAANSIVYSIGFFQDGLYASVAGALLCSLPIQVISFLMWNKKKYKKTATIIKNLNAKHKILSFSLIAIASAVSVFVFSRIDGTQHYIIDGISFVIGYVASIYIAFGILDGMFLNVANSLLKLPFWIIIVAEGNRANVTYLVMAIYTLFRVSQSFINWIKLYIEQRAQRENSEAVK